MYADHNQTPMIPITLATRAMPGHAGRSWRDSDGQRGVFRRLAICGLAACMVGAPLGCSDSGSKPKPSGMMVTDSSGGDGTTTPPPAGKAEDSQKPVATRDYTSPVVLSAMREQAIEMVMACGRSRDASVRANAAEASLQAPSRLEPVLAAALKDENLGVRSVAAAVVGRLQIRSLVAATWPLLSDSSPFVQSSAIYALRRCGESVDPSPLSRFLLNDPSPKVRSHAAYLLGELAEPSAAPMIRSAVKSAMPRASEADIRLMQLQFAEALVKLGEETQIESIRAALYPSRPEELEATALAVQIIGMLKDQGSTNQLIYLSAKLDKAGNPMPAEIRLGVATALARMGNRRGNFIAEEFWNDANPVLRAQAASVFGFTAQPDGLVYLDRLLTDPSEQVRVTAAAAVLRALGSGSGSGVGGR